MTPDKIFCKFGDVRMAKCDRDIKLDKCYQNIDKSKQLIPSDSKTTNQLVTEGLALGNGTKTTGSNLLGIQLMKNKTE